MKTVLIATSVLLAGCSAPAIPPDILPLPMPSSRGQYRSVEEARTVAGFMAKRACLFAGRRRHIDDAGLLRFSCSSRLIGLGISQAHMDEWTYFDLIDKGVNTPVTFHFHEQGRLKRSYAESGSPTSINPKNPAYYLEPQFKGSTEIKPLLPPTPPAHE